MFESNSQKKDQDFQYLIFEKFEEWKSDPEQRQITARAEKEHMADVRKKMQVLKKDFELKLENRFKEGMLNHAHKNGLRNLVSEAKRLSTSHDIKDDHAAIKNKFKELWAKTVESLSCGAKIDEVSWTYCKNLESTFRGVNKFMPQITAR